MSTIKLTTSTQGAITRTVSDKSASGERRPYHHGNLREALLEAAELILEEEGLAGLSLRAVARRAGVSRTAPYRHFDDKDDLLSAVAARGFRLLARSLEQASDGTAEPSDHMRGMARGYVRFASRHRALFRLMFGTGRPQVAGSEELSEEGARAYAVIADAMAARTGAAPRARDATLAAWSLVHGLAMLVNEGVVAPDAPGEEALDALVDRVASHLRLGPRV